MESQTQNPRNPAEANENAGYVALKEGAALVEHEKAVLRLTGKDSVGMLNAILTNQVPEEANLGVYALLLNSKGRVQADLRILKEPSGGSVLVVAEREGAEAARDILRRYAPFSHVKIEDLSGSWRVLGFYGPRVGELFGGVELREHEAAAVEIRDATLCATGVATPVQGFDLLGPTEIVRVARRYLIEGGAVPAGHEVYETARVEAGVPRFGTDMTPENFPGETGVLDRAVSFTKGCYPGQETVARMHYRGHPNKKLHRLVVEGTPPSPGAPILQDGKQAGGITSVAPRSVDGRTFILGYLSRKADLEGPLHAGGATILVSEASG